MSTRRLLLTLVLLAGYFALGPVLGAAEDEKKPVTSKEAAAEKEKFARFQKEMTGQNWSDSLLLLVNRRGP